MGAHRAVCCLCLLGLVVAVYAGEGPLGAPPAAPPAEDDKLPALTETWIRIRAGERGPDGKPKPSIAVDEAPIADWDAFRAAVLRLSRVPGATRSVVIIDAATDAHHGWVVRVIDALSKAGFTNINVKPDDRQPPALPAPAGAPLPKRREESVVTIETIETDGKRRPRVTINGTAMENWPHVSRSMRHLAGDASKQRGNLRLLVKARPDVPFEHVYQLMSVCIRTGVWQMKFVTWERDDTSRKEDPEQ